MWLLQKPEQPFTICVQHPAGDVAGMKRRRKSGDSRRRFTGLGDRRKDQQHGRSMREVCCHGKEIYA
jgi:hypothetical protein